MKVFEEVFIPQESVNDDNVVITKLFFKNGDSVEKGNEILEFETSKTIVEIESSFDGYIAYYCNEGDTVNVGTVVAKIVDDYKHKEEKQLNSEKQSRVQEKNHNSNVKTIFSLRAMDLMKKYGLNEKDFPGKDFVNENDIYLFLNSDDKNINENTTAIKQNENTIRKKIIKNEDTHTEKLSIQKLREIEYLSTVKKYGLISSVSVFVDLENVMNFVNLHLSLLKGSFLPIIVYELARLLNKFPKLNAYFENESIIYYNDVNVGIAIDMEKGLKVLQINNTDKLSLVSIEEEILSISKRYIENKVTPQDSSNITFTITDLSSEGIATFSPLINKYNSAILAISSPDTKLNRIDLTLTFDHRVTEGKYIARFLYELKKRIESYISTYPSNEKLKNNQDIRCYKCHRKLSNDLDGNVTFFKVLDENGDEKILCNICYENY